MDQTASKPLLSLLYVSFLVGLCFSTEDGGSKFLGNVCKFISDYTALYSRRWKYSELVLGRVLTILHEARDQ
jgi:hypothetical protein